MCIIIQVPDRRHNNYIFFPVLSDYACPLVPISFFSLIPIFRHIQHNFQFIIEWNRLCFSFFFAKPKVLQFRKLRKSEWNSSVSLMESIKPHSVCSNAFPVIYSISERTFYIFRIWKWWKMCKICARWCEIQTSSIWTGSVFLVLYDHKKKSSSSSTTTEFEELKMQKFKGECTRTSNTIRK